MTNRTADEIRSAVSAAYGARARAVAAGDASSCCGDPRAAAIKDQLYTGDDTDGLPDSVVSYGCGNPTAIAGLRPGEVVLDLGAGAGLDCFLAARQVGDTGRVIGLDMTDDMLALAEANRARLGVTNVEFRKGIMESVPVADACVDVIISNCVINLSPDKDAVFREAFRVLRPGGRLHVSDIVLLHDLSPAEQQDLDLWAGCISGALSRDDYADRLRAAGFADVAVEVADAGSTEDEPARPWRSALITARRPDPDAAAADRVELLAPGGLQAPSCCGPAATEAPRCC